MVAFAALFAFTACEDPNTEDPNNNGGGNNNTPTALAKPVLSVDELTNTSFVVKWEAVENASGYMVNDGSQNHNVTATSFKMENLNAGTYTVKVMAVGEGNYENSEWATIKQEVKGAQPEDVDWVERVVSLPTEEDQQYGHFPFMHIYDSFKGTGIVEIKNGCFDSATYGKHKAEDLAKECTAFDADTVAQANSQNGVTVVFSGVQAETEYRVVAVVTNDKGVTVIFDDKITTTEAKAHPAVADWEGLWEITTEKVFVIPVADNEEIYVTEATTTVGVEVVPALDFQYNAVAVYGMSFADRESTPALGLVGYDEEGNSVLYLMNWQAVGAAQDGSYYMMWNTWSEVNMADGTQGYYLVAGEYPSFMVSNGVGTPYAGQLQGGGTFDVLAWDIYAYDASGQLLGWFYSGEEDIRLEAGAQTWTRVDAVPSSNSMRAPKNFNVNSVVLPSVVAM